MIDFDIRDQSKHLSSDCNLTSRESYLSFYLKKMVKLKENSEEKGVRRPSQYLQLNYFTVLL